MTKLETLVLVAGLVWLAAIDPFVVVPWQRRRREAREWQAMADEQRRQARR